MKVDEEGSFEAGESGLGLATAVNGDFVGFEADPTPGGAGGWTGRGNRNPSSCFTGVTNGVDSANQTGRNFTFNFPMGVFRILMFH